MDNEGELVGHRGSEMLVEPTTLLLLTPDDLVLPATVRRLQERVIALWVHLLAVLVGIVVA